MVRLLMASNIPRPQALATIAELLVDGRDGGRREAAHALAEFSGAEANALALRFLGDPDPHVQAHIVRQLRSRGIPGILQGLVEMVDSPHAVVRKAARESLAEFSFRRYLAAFEMLDEEVRQATGVLVKKIDPQTVPLLKEELCSPMRTRRLRAVAIARLIELVEPLEKPLIELLHDQDHMVRMAAVGALAESAQRRQLPGLRSALSDTSEVRAAGRAARRLRARRLHAPGDGLGPRRVTRCTTCSPTACCWPHEAAWTISASPSKGTPPGSIAGT